MAAGTGTLTAGTATVVGRIGEDGAGGLVSGAAVVAGGGNISWLDRFIAEDFVRVHTLEREIRVRKIEETIRVLEDLRQAA